ncbi:MAG: hypothetical protein Kow0069_25770 [Promethearchaeota archaeon]
MEHEGEARAGERDERRRAEDLGTTAFLLVAAASPLVELVFRVGLSASVATFAVAGLALVGARHVVFSKATPGPACRRALRLGASLVLANWALGTAFAALDDPASFPARHVAWLGASVAFFASLRWRGWEAFSRLNDSARRAWSDWVGRGRHRRARTATWGALGVLWAVAFAAAVLAPVPIKAVQSREPGSAAGRVGFWTYGVPLDPDRENGSRYVDDDVLAKMGAAGFHVVYGIRADKLNDEFVERLSRLAIHGVEVHLSVTPVSEEDEFVNFWTFGRLRQEIEQVLAFVKRKGLLHDPVTTLVYDVEGLPSAHFPTYGFNASVAAGLSPARYREALVQFREFNDHVARDWGLSVRICTDVYQLYDGLDGDDDVSAMWGLLDDPRASRSYMAYRRNNLGQNHVLYHDRLARDGDVVILNAWKFPDHACWEDLDCALQDAKLVLNHPNKELGVEVWALWYFLKSFGAEGLDQFVDELASEKVPADGVSVARDWPDSFTTDALYVGIAYLDHFGALLRAFYSLVGVAAGLATTAG